MNNPFNKQLSILERQYRAKLKRAFLAQDFFWHPDLWPAYLQEIFYTQHKNYDQRYAIAKFFVYNGLHWQSALDWTLVDDVHGYIIYSHNYSKSDVRSVKAYVLSLSSRLEAGMVNPADKYFDMTAGRVL